MEKDLANCLSHEQTETETFARRVDFDVTEIHFDLAFSPSKLGNFEDP